jgi:glycosyltransferase involved in cell wall biosynthesis
MNEITFSICIPNYNYAQYIGETIQSVLDQSHQNFEIIIADNASTDNSVEVIQSFDDERIRLIQNRYNIGFAPNLQQVTREAKNDFMILLSSDDRMMPDALEMYAEVIALQGDTANKLIIYSEAYQINGQGEKTPYPIHQYPFYERLQPVEKIISCGCSVKVYRGEDVLKEAILQLGPAGPFLTMAYPRVLYEAVEGYNNIHLTDPDAHFSHKILRQYPDVAWINEPLFEYRVHGSNQLDQQRKQASIKKPIDKYLHTIEIEDSLLQRLGLTRNDLIRTFVNKYCINEMFFYLARNHYHQAFKGLSFAFTTYPGQVLRSWRAYLLAFLLLLGPLAPATTRLFRNIYKSLGGKMEYGYFE